MMLSATQRKEILYRYRLGESAASIASIIGVTPGIIYQTARRNGLHRATKVCLTESQHREIVRLYETGEKTTYIASLYHIHVDRVCRIAHAAGAPRRRAPRVQCS